MAVKSSIDRFTASHPKSQQLWERAKNQVTVELELKRHRASSDARIIQMAYKQTLMSLD